MELMKKFIEESKPVKNLSMQDAARQLKIIQSFIKHFYFCTEQQMKWLKNRERELSNIISEIKEAEIENED